MTTSPVQSAGPSGPTHGKSVSPGPWATRLSSARNVFQKNTAWRFPSSGIQCRTTSALFRALVYKPCAKNWTNWPAVCWRRAIHRRTRLRGCGSTRIMKAAGRINTRRCGIWSLRPPAACWLRESISRTATCPGTELTGGRRTTILCFRAPGSLLSRARSGIRFWNPRSSAASQTT